MLIFKTFCRENTTSADLIENDEFLIPLHLKFTETDCQLGLSHGQCSDDQYRSLDGSCNNMVYPTWGMSGQVLRRYLSPGYHDGQSSMSYDVMHSGINPLNMWQSCSRHFVSSQKKLLYPHLDQENQTSYTNI